MVAETYYEEPAVVEEEVVEVAVVEEPVVVEPVAEEFTTYAPTKPLEVVEEHIINDVEEEVVYYDPNPSTVPPTQEPSDYVEAVEEPEVVEPDYLPEPPVIKPPPPTYAAPDP